ncbi:MAG: hypothetical protein HDT37_05260 [Clostridiales bacterium]|nr:hypothetical protein [Clostridiales bacterium]
MELYKSVFIQYLVALASFVVVYVLLNICGNFLREGWKKVKYVTAYKYWKLFWNSGLVKWLRSNGLATILLFPAIVVITGNALALVLPSEPDSGYSYLPNGIASECNVGNLFSEDNFSPIMEQENRVLKALHFSKDLLGQRISEEMVNLFRESLGPIYRNGYRPDADTSPLEHIGLGEYAYMDVKTIHEAIRYIEAYENDHSLSQLYQYGRCLVDFGLIYHGLMLKTYLEVAADSMNALEEYLALLPENNQNSELVKPDYVTFIVGKLLTRISEIAATSGELEYSDVLLCEAYVLFELSYEISEENIKIHALSSYYMALLSQRLMKRMKESVTDSSPMDTSLYSFLGNTAIDHYSMCEGLYDTSPGLFKDEPSSRTNIASGKKTLTDWGF